MNQFSYVAAPAPGITNPADCTGAYQPNVATNPNAPGSPISTLAVTNAAFYPVYNPVLAPYDLTRGGTPYDFIGHTDVKELALYVRDNITKGNWSLNLGLRGDLYNGLSVARQAEPRVGVAYNIKRTNTILRISYARTLESPFNEISSSPASDAKTPF